MQAFIPYAVKVIIISTILYTYYYFVLRNKNFHRYNRFYLLASIALSIALPVIPFESVLFWNTATPPAMDYDFVGKVIVFQGVQEATWNWQSIIIVSCWMVSTILTILFVASLLRIFLIRKKGLKQAFNEFTLVKTLSKGTPFSFFKDVFWNPDVETKSTEGEGMLRHELVHVKQFHSVDKLVVNLVQIVFWFNPVFWMMKRELYMIHEFLADRGAFGDEGVADFSKMALYTAYPGYTWPATNSFFHRPIKRRLMMLLKNNKQRATYWGRVMTLPLAMSLFIFFSMKAKAIQVGDTANSAVEKVTLPDTINDTIPQNIKTITIHPTKAGKNQMIIEYTNGATDSLSLEEAEKKGIYLPAPPPPPPPAPATFPFNFGDYKNVDIETHTDKPYITFIGKDGKKDSMSLSQAEAKGIPIPPPPPPPTPPTPPTPQAPPAPPVSKRTDITIEGLKSNNPLYILDGKRVSSSEFHNNTNVDEIQSVSVIKGENAIAAYGEDGKEGVVIITTKGNLAQNQKDRKPGSLTIRGDMNSPLILLNRKTISREEMNKIAPSEISSIDILKGDKAIKIYGDSGKEGVILITTKKSDEDVENATIIEEKSK